MSEPLTEYMAVRCTSSMKQNLDAIASKGINRNVADHVRYAVELYIDGVLSTLESEEVERVRQEVGTIFGQDISKGDLLVKLINHWDATKRDSYGYSRFA